jgi:hypothetical protein
VGAKEVVEFVSHHTRLNDHPTRSHIQADDPMKVAAAIHDDSGADHLPRKGCSGCSGNQRRSGFVCKPDQLGHFALSFREGNRHGEFLIFRGIGRMELASEQIGVEPLTKQPLEL